MLVKQISLYHIVGSTWQYGHETPDLTSRSATAFLKSTSVSAMWPKASADLTAISKSTASQPAGASSKSYFTATTGLTVSKQSFADHVVHIVQRLMTTTLMIYCRYLLTEGIVAARNTTRIQSVMHLKPYHKHNIVIHRVHMIYT